MTWNYRIIKNKGAYAIHEVYYDKRGRATSWTENPVYPVAETVEDLMYDIDQMLQAQERPILKVVGDKLVEKK